jgi:hypothetical protein
MTDSREATRRPVRAPLGRRSRRRWAIVGAVAMCWLFVEFGTGSALTATVLLVAIAGLGVAAVAGLRAMGITRDHPWLQRMAARPWRDGQDVLNAAMRHLPDVFIVMPSGSLIAPDVVELQMSPDDLASLRERMELDVVATSLTEVYQDQVAERGARFAGSCQPEVYVAGDGSLPQGRYRLRQGRPVGARYSPGTRNLPDAPDLMDLQFGYVAPEYAATALDPVSGGSAPEWGYPEPAPGPGYAQPVGVDSGGLAWYEVADPGRTIMDGAATVMEQIRPSVPVLRLVTGSSVAETSMSGARAGRGPVELMLPDVPTVSREHARFTFSEGRWWVTNQGMNGLFVNGVPVSVKQPLIDGDSIRWGASSDAPQSRIEIGSSR